MKFKKAIIKGDVPGHVKVKKAAMISIAFNVLEIVAGLTMIVLVNRMLAGGVEAGLARLTTLLCVTIVGWGAVSDISAALTSLNLVQKTKELEEAYGQLEDLNRQDGAIRSNTNHIGLQVSKLLLNLGIAQTFRSKDRKTQLCGLLFNRRSDQGLSPTAHRIGARIDTNDLMRLCKRPKNASRKIRRSHIYDTHVVSPHQLRHRPA